MKRGETKTFSYSSTTSTDQEVIIYHAQYIKALDNLSNLNPSSCILANARKLTNVEIHSTELYNINVTNNTFLRSINLEGCSTLGTVTATGSSLDLSNCKYLRYCNVYNTALTEVQLNTSGGSLVEILYPKTIQSINLIKQRLLEKIGLPYGSGGDEIPTSLYTISIQECPSIKYLNTSDNSNINTTFASMVYCNNLTIRNSLDLRRLTFDGFYRLKNVVIENMYNLEELGFNDLLPKGNASTLQYIGLSNCPLLEVLELNCTSNEYEITFANKAILNLGGLFGLKSIESNCVLKGIETIVVPLNLESMFFTNEYGEGYSTIKNIWSSSVCTVNTSGSTAKAQHINPTYVGIDFAGMNLKNIDLGALVNIPKAINFTLHPTTVNPHFNLNRDGETYPYLQPVGTLDLSNYTESLARFFDGVDLDKLKIVCTNNLPQTDLSYCFYNATFSNDTAINTLLSKVSSITNLDYCFYKTTVADTSILSKISMGKSSTMNYTFAECPNITNLKNVIIPSTVMGIEGMFYKCPLTAITNMIVNVNGSISGLFKGCTELTTISTLRIPNVTDVSSTFEGCTSLTTLTGFELPSSCTNVSNLFNGCYMLTSISMNFGSNILAGENWYPPNLETLNDSNIESGYVKMTNCSTLKNVNNLYINNGDYSDMFNGCSNLATLTLTMGTNITGLARFIKGCSKITSKPFTEIPETCITIEEMFNGTNITDISGMIFGSKITNAKNWLPIGLITANNVTIKNNHTKFRKCATLVECNNLTITSNVTSLSAFFMECTKLSRLTFSDTCDTSNVTYFSDVFRDCYELGEIDFAHLNLTEVTSMSDCFRHVKFGCIISNITLSDKLTIYGIERVFYAKSSIIRNIYIPNNLVAQKIFQHHSFPSLSIKEVSGIRFAPEVTDITGMLQGAKLITTDFIIPSHITNCTNCFKDCTSMTHIHSNWNNSYTNGITATDCYAGCTSIAYFDDRYILGYNGDEGLDYIPREWGGFGFVESETSIFEIEIPSDGYKFRPVYYYYNLTRDFSIAGNNIIKWGDGTYWTNESNRGNVPLPLHTYEKAGTYYVKGNYITRVYNNAYELIDTAVKCHRLAYDKNRSHMFKGLKKLTYINWDAIDMTGVNDCLYLFSDCESLPQEYIKVSENWDMSNVENVGLMYRGCTLLTDINLSNWNTNKFKNLNNFLTNTNISSIESLSNWNLPNLIYAWEAFKGTKITDFSPLNSWTVPKLSDVQGMFSDNTALQSITVPDWFKNSTITNVGSLFFNCSNLKEIHNFDWNGHFNSGDAVGSFPLSVIERCTALTTIEDINMNYTSILGTKHDGLPVTDDYWSRLAWNIFENLNNLQNINFTGTVTLYESVKVLRFFVNCDVSKFTLETWQSFVDTLPITTDSYAIKVNKGLATIPDTIVSQITNKGYTLTT